MKYVDFEIRNYLPCSSIYRDRSDPLFIISTKVSGFNSFHDTYIHFVCDETVK